ncbi:N-acyl-phosphatidylethanolamine-hydrolyzing phospholipase D [Dermatophagoides farinae]|uniref:N-acyl-phosphatidylethanolamine-hydrolyzing phospholipase d-like protein n=1 Tax=Dermatophagoides farinae TaxID=6954 RepID=A0A9D4SHK7_DERFA|nr:N-acyl-phosphatidylethanolamine-hydrolyzing phospholipase D-like [Dermatophagoides farinae]KAH7642714.1 n-acyl-phosphatidylethanolamine-hydrolyzing phospholipase d-like protein [Dermatophagoides farinae]
MIQKFKFLSKRTNSCEQNDDYNNNDSSVITSGSEKKLVSRNAVICSSGKDKYRHDSERANIPIRPVNSELEYVPESNNNNNNHLKVNNPIHASRQSMYCTNDLIASTSSLCPSHHSQLSRQNSTTSQVVKRHTVVNRLDLESSMMIGGKFQNPWPNYRSPTFTNILKLGLSRDKSNVASKKDLNQHLPILEPNISTEPPENSFRITWLGHASVLAEFDNMAVLTDPMFSERASPSQVIGPKRYRDPPCTVHDLPSNLDAVVISHSHYDHLDLNTVVLLNARYGSDLRWFIPIGLGDWFGRVGCENVVELDWWEENCVPDKNDVSFVFTPSQHWSKRTLTDDNKSLWGSWVVKGPRYRFFFTGDTGFCDVFKRIGSIYGPFDVSAIPIGSYEPRRYMKYQHINPAEAVQLHKDLRSKFSVAIHWGTFAFSDEHFLEPRNQLRIEAEKARINCKKFATFMHGETRIITPSGKVESTHQNKIVT